MIERRITPQLRADLIKKMVLLSGPRQCGKTTIVRAITQEERYFRTRMGHEVDFVLLRNGRPWLAIEAKLAEQALDSGLRYLLERVAVPYAFQVHLRGGRERTVADIGKSKVRHVSAARLLASLP